MSSQKPRHRNRLRRSGTAPVPVDENGPPPPKCRRIQGRPRRLNVLAFSDCRTQDIGVLLDYVAALRTPLDLILYAGDDVSRFHPDGQTDYFELLADETAYGLCAVIGNDERSEARELISGRRVYDVHKHPVILGRFIIVGLEGAPIIPGELGIGYTLYPEDQIATHLRRSLRYAAGRSVVILSHVPPRGVLDRAVRFGDRCIGSHALAGLLKTSRRKIPLVVCGHVHRHGGRHERLRRTTIANAASHDRAGEPLRLAEMTITPTRVADIRWHELPPTRAVCRSTEAPGADFQQTIELQRVPGVGWARSEHLIDAGITSIEQLMKADPAAIAGSPGLGHAEAKRIVVRAQALHESRPIALRQFTLPEGDHLYLDIETDLAQRWAWLIGCYSERTGEFVQFDVRQPDSTAERAMLIEFLEHLEAFADPSFLTYSNSRLEERVITSRLQHFKLPAPPSDRFVDVCIDLQRVLAPPCGTYELKRLCASLGYRYRYPDLDGLVVATEYFRRLEAGRTPITRRMSAYNRDDVMSLRFLCQQAEQICSANRALTGAAPRADTDARSLTTGVQT